MTAGITTPNLPPVSTIADLIGNVLVGGVKSTGRIVFDDLADALAERFATLLDGGWRNIPVIVTGAYAISDADHGSTLMLSGSSSYTVSVPAATSVREGFQCVIVNVETASEKRILYSGGASHILWPNQSKHIFRAATKLVRRPHTERGRLEGFNTFHVDQANGSNNYGLTGGLSPVGSGPFKWIQDAMDTILKDIDCANSMPTIQVSGAISGQLISMAFAGQPLGSTQITIRGNIASPSKWTPTANNQTKVQARDQGTLTIQGFDFDNTGYTGNVDFNPSQEGIIDYSDCWFGPSPAGTHILLQGGGSLNWIGTPGSNNYKIYGLGAGSQHWSCTGPCHFAMGGATINLPNVLTFGTFLTGIGPGLVNWGANAFSGPGAGAGSTGTKYTLAGNFVVSSGGTILPGSAPGVAATGGQWL